MKRSSIHLYSLIALLAGSLSACNGTSVGGSTAAVDSGATTSQNTIISTPSSPAPSVNTPPTVVGKPVPRTYTTDVLLFNGDGTWSAEVSSLRNILDSHSVTYQLIDSRELEAMTSEDLAKYGLLLFPGGSGGTQAGSLSSAAHARLRAAVQQQGISYLGFCAGAFIAVAPKPAAGKDVSYGLGVVEGPVLDYYFLENQGTDIAMTSLSFTDGSKKNTLWYGGPMTPEKGVVARYPDGTAAISEMWSGKGFVVLSGPHPTATQSMLSSLGVSASDGIQIDLAWQLIDSALHQRIMPSFN